MPRRSARVTWLLAAVTAAAAVTGPALAAPPTPVFGSFIEGLASYDGQDTCSPTAKAGTVALRSLVLATYRGTGDYGIVRACSVGGMSEHKEGRAWDWKVNAYDPAQDAAARDLFQWLLATDSRGNRYALARRLGIMYMIYNRHMWSAYNADAGWRPYTGANPHTDHVHVSLSWPGANKTTSYWLSPLDSRYTSDAGVRAALGAATGAEQFDGDVRWRAYERGRMYWTPSTGARYLLGPLLESYLRAGGHRELGVPVIDELVTPDGTGRYNHFTKNASVYWTDSTGARTILGPLRQAWAASGWETGPLGYPTTDTTATPDGTGRYNHFTKNASVYWTDSTGARTVLGPLRQAWAASGWETGPLGYPTTDTTATPDGTGRYNHFTKNASVYWTDSTGARTVLGPLRQAWAASGWETGPLGYPTTDTTATPDGTGRYNHFTKNASLYWTPTTEARSILGPLRQAWAASGWETGPLGYPSTDTTATPDGTGRYNHFTKNASVYWTDSTGARTVLGPLRQAWAASGWETGPLGYPTTDSTATPDGTGRYNHFTKNASLYWTPTTGARSILGPLRQAWAASGWETGPLGYPSTDTTATPDGTGRYNHFTKNASLYWTPTTGARSILGPLRQAWAASGWETGPLGYPSTDTTATPDGTGRYNHFTKNASLYWTPTTGARSILGPLRQAWAASGWETGPLGYPSTDTTATPDGTGRYNHFTKNASLYWTPTTGARSILGPLRQAWAASGWETGPLGYPSTDSTATPDGTGRYNHFTKNASLYWTPTTGARSILAPTRDRWAQLGWERGYLGYPTSNEYAVSDGRRTDFVGGTITVTARGAVDAPR